MAPPSPVVKTLFPQKLNIEESAIDPTFFPLIDEPNPSAASSINIKLFFFAVSRISNILQDSPP